MTDVPQILGALESSSLSRREVDELTRYPQRVNSPAILRRRFPKLSGVVRIQDFPLNVRVHGCLERLQKSHNLSDLSELHRFSIADLLRLKNFGRKSLIDLLTALRTVIIDEDDGNIASQRSPLVTSSASHMRAQGYASRIRCNDLRLGIDACALLTIANACNTETALPASSPLSAVAHRIAGRTQDKTAPEVVLAIFRRIRAKIAQINRLKLERELEEVASTLTRGRSLQIVLSFYGWTGQGTKTLQNVGDEFGITRERVRQITNKFAKQLKSAYIYTPTLKRVLTFVARSLPSPENEVESQLVNAGLTRANFHTNGIIGAAELLGLSIPFLADEYQGTRILVRHEDIGLADLVMRLARRVVSHAGLGKVADLKDYVFDEKGIRVEAISLKGILEAAPGLCWLDEHREWFLLIEAPKNHLTTLVKKVLSVAPRIHVDEMRGAIAGDYRGVGFSPPRTVVMEFCKVMCDCNVENDVIVASKPLPPMEALSKGELIAYGVLKDEGKPLLHRSDFERLCIQRGMNPSTFSNYVGRLYILERYGPGVYGLRGASVVPGDVERCIPPATRRFRDHGWTEDAKPWLLVELSAAALSTGVITIPAAFTQFIQGKYLIHALDDSTMGTLVVSKNSGWGLRPLFLRRGGEVGDLLELTFDIQRQNVFVRLGTRESAFAEE